MQINRNVKIAGGFAAVAVIWMLTGAFSGNEKQEKTKEVKQVRVLAKKIVSESYVPSVEVVGRTEVAQEVDLVAEVSGKVESIAFEQGETVKTGDLMLTLENSYRKDNLLSAEEELKSAKLKLDIAKNLAKQAYKAKTDLADRQAEYTRALSDLTNAKRDYDNSFVTAPISGFIEKKNVSLGDYVAADTVLYKIISQDEMYLVGYLSQNQIEKVKLGQHAYGIFDDNNIVGGEVSFISQKADENTKTYKMEVTIKIKNEDFIVREGVTVKINIPTKNIDVYRIPHSALVLADDGRVGVRVVGKDNKVEFYEITLVKDSHSYLLVQTGTVGDLNLIVRGHVDVQTGMTVDVAFDDEKKEDK